MARRGELCAGIMLTFPVSSSTICTCPGERPGKASNFCPKQASPIGLSVVSNTDSFLGGFEKAKIWMLFSKATTMRDFDKRTPRTEVRNSSVMTAFCFTSSQMTSYTAWPLGRGDDCGGAWNHLHTLFCGNLGCLPPPTIAK